MAMHHGEHCKRRFTRISSCIGAWLTPLHLGPHERRYLRQGVRRPSNPVLGRKQHCAKHGPRHRDSRKQAACLPKLRISPTLTRIRTGLE